MRSLQSLSCWLAGTLTLPCGTGVSVPVFVQGGRFGGLREWLLLTARTE